MLKAAIFSGFLRSGRTIVLCSVCMGIYFETGSARPQTAMAVKRDSILARVTFENRRPGERYGLFDVKRDFGTLQSLGTVWPLQRASVDSLDPVHRHVLRIKYPERKVRSLASGASWKLKSFYPRQELFLSYWVFFPDSFVFRHGGKLHGIVGGKGNTGGNKPSGHDGWSCRVHWGFDDMIKLYVYHKDQNREWGDEFYFTEDPPLQDITDRSTLRRFREREIHVKPGVWHHIQIRVKVNAVHHRNGLAQAWYDGRLVADVRGFAFRDSTCGPEDLLINAMYFSTFFGGRDEAYKPVKDEAIFFDDFVVCTRLFRPDHMPYEGVPE
ncbi:hypothetical protein JW948_10715 [bacterium]|nr:hypothetical protein [bacterium]